MRPSPCSASLLLVFGLSLILGLVSGPPAIAHDPDEVESGAPVSDDTPVSRLDAALVTSPPSPSDGDVESVLLDGDRIFAGTAEGIWSYDGLDWRRHAFADTVRWIERRGGEVWAGGTRGVWTADAAALEFDRSAEGPAGNRCALTEGDTLWVGADDGLWRRIAGRWEQVREGARVQCLIRHPRFGLVAGTWGAGLWILGREGGWREMRSPGAGLTDTLSGNYIHDLDVGEEGDLRIACSWGGLERRLIAHGHARERGWITPRDPHDFRRASLARYDGRNWQVTYLLQNYTDTDLSRIDLVQPSLRGDLDGDGHEEWLMGVDSGRRLHPRGLACFDLETLESDWYLPLLSAGGHQQVILRNGLPHVVQFGGAGDQGTVLSHSDDRRSFIHIIRGDGVVIRSHEVPWTSHIVVPRTQHGELPDEDDSLRIFRFPAAGSRVRTPSWILSLDDLELAPADSLWINPNSIVHEHGDTLLEIALSRDEPGIPLRHDATGPDPRSAWPAEDMVRAFGETPRFFTAVTDSTGRHGALLHGNEEMAVWRDGIRSRSRYPSPAGQRQLYWGGLDAQFGCWLLALDDETGNTEIWRAEPPLTHRPFFRRFQAFSMPRIPVLRSVSALPARWRVDGHEFARRYAGLVDDEGRLSGWMVAQNDGGTLPVLDLEGRQVGVHALPPRLADARVLEWLHGVPARLDDRPVAALAGLGRLPLTIFLLDPRSRTWEGSLELDLPYRDLRANGLTALGPHDRLVGSESGLRSLVEEDSLPEKWSRGAGERIRGFETLDTRRVVAYGSSGLITLRRAVDDSTTRAIDLFEQDGDLYLLRERSVLQRDADQTQWTELEWRPGDASLGPDSRLLSGPNSAWLQRLTTPGTVHSPQRVSRPNRLWHPSHSPLYFQGSERQCSAIVELSADRWLAATAWGLILIEDPRGPNARGENLVPQNTPCTSMVRTDDGNILVARADGAVHELDPEYPRELRDSPRSRPRARAVLEMLVEGEVVWARTRKGLEKWTTDGDRRWELPGGVETRGMDASSKAGTWLATNSGLWRLSDRRQLLVPTSPETIGRRPVSRVWEVGPDSSRTLATLCDGELHEFSIAESRPLVRHRREETSVAVALWRDGPLHNPGQAILEGSSLTPRRVAGRVGDDGVARYQLPALGRGRHELTLTALDHLGRELDPPLHTRLEVWEAHPAAAFAAMILPVPPLAIWVFLRRRSRWFGLGAIAFAVTVPLVIYHVFMFAVPWATVGGVSMSLVITGLVLLGRDTRREVPPAEAVHRLIALLAAFRHRGRGISPVHRLSIVARNLDTLAEAGDDVATETQSILRDVLDATDDLEAQMPRLIESSALRSPVLRRLQRRLEELRETSAELLEDRSRVLRWCADADERLATQELCLTFLRSVGTASLLLRRHEGANLPELLAEFCRNAQHDVSVELRLDEEIGEVPVPASGLNEILENLESNAVQANGGVPPRVLIEVVRTAAGDVVLSFEDDGPGVPPAQRERIFERGVSGTGGSGTGLHRCRSLVTGWGGTLRCEEPVGLGGARFVLRIPVSGGG